MKGEQRIASSSFWTVNPSVLGQLAPSRSRHCRTSLTPKVTSLANYFATTDGKTFFEVLRTAIDVAEEDECDLKIHKL